jgi:hypothetical protein
VGATDTLTFTISDSANVTNMAFTDTFPGSLVVATPNGLTPATGCGSPTITATAGSGTVSFSGGILTGGTPCTFSVNVTSATTGKFPNSVSMTANAVSGGPATATVTYVAPPTISKVFGAPRIPVGGSTSLSFTVGNPAGNPVSLAGIGFTDTLPAGLLVANPPGISGSCGGGAIAAGPGSTTITLSGATLAAGASCTFSVNVTAIASGTQVNTTSTITSGSVTGLTATASIIVDPPDGILMSYVSNLNQGDSSVDLTNGGQNGAFLGQNGSNGDICANVYVFDPAQELLACCSCLVTPDGLNSFSVKNDLINKSLTSATPTSLVIKIVATPRITTATCAGTAAAPPTGALAGGLRAWGTTLHQNTTAGYSVTENAFQPVIVGTAEFTSLSQMCGFVIAEGSNNFGFCNNACANTGLSGAKK